MVVVWHVWVCVACMPVGAHAGRGAAAILIPAEGALLLKHRSIHTPSSGLWLHPHWMPAQTVFEHS